MTGLPVRVLPDEVLGRDPYRVQRRTRRKGRTNKKWRKRYGMVTRYRSFNTIVAGGAVFMARSMYEAFRRDTGKENNR